ncbi:MAG: aminotransferase class IV, partial [Candidatus Binatia bacterium]
MTKATCFLNGRYIPVAKAVIPAVDRGFLFGEGLFETWRTYNGRPFALRQHLERMRKSARALGIPFDPGEPWESRTRRLARINQMVEGGGAVRLTITRGSGPVSLVPGEPVNPTRLMLFRPLESGLAEARENGVAVHLMAFGPGVNPALRKLKTLNYLPAVMGKVAARKLGCFESLYRLDDSTVLEGTTSNYFIVRSGKLITPPVGGGVLPGITRAMVMQIASRLINIEEQVLKVAD